MVWLEVGILPSVWRGMRESSVDNDLSVGRFFSEGCTPPRGWGRIMPLTSFIMLLWRSCVLAKHLSRGAGAGGLSILTVSRAHRCLSFRGMDGKKEGRKEG